GPGGPGGPGGADGADGTVGAPADTTSEPCADGRRRPGRPSGRERRDARGLRLLGIVGWAIPAAAAITIGTSAKPPLEALFGPSTGFLFLGSVVVMIGIAAVVGAWVGDPRGLMTAGTLAVVLLMASAAVDLTSLNLGSPQWRPTSVAAAERTYTLTGGQARLDLTRVPLEPGERVEVGAEVDFGSLTVLVPAESRVQVRSRASFGEVRIDETVRWGTGLDVRRTLEPEGAADSGGGGRRTDGAGGGSVSDDPPTLVVDLVSRIGDLGVRRAAS
ncbi:hypothetical protein ACFFN5_09850, partial [Streptomonospora salina]